MNKTVDALLQEPEVSETEQSPNPLGDLTREFHFPTGIYFRDFQDPEKLNAKIIPRIRQLREEDEKGIKGSHIPSLGGWHSNDQLKKDPIFAELTARLEKTMRQISEDAGYHPDCEIELDNMWAIINPPGSYNKSHVHPRSLWSGVYYLQVPENAGRIGFTDPRIGKVMLDPGFHPDRPRKPEHWVEVFFQPKVGRLILFPSWLYHAVEANRSEAEGEAGERIIISFNFTQRRAPPRT